VIVIKETNDDRASEEIIKRLKNEGYVGGSISGQGLEKDITFHIQKKKPSIP